MKLYMLAIIALSLGAIAGVEAATITVVQRGQVFDRSSAAVTHGDRMVFTNEDDVIHNIHVFGPGEDQKDLGVQKPGATLSYTFDKAGTFMIRCNIHPSMRMTVTVK
jgi:plastocyanin